MSFILKSFIILHFGICYIFLYTYELVSIFLKKFKSKLMNPVRQLSQNDVSFRTTYLPHNKKLLRYKLYLDYAVNLLKTTNKSNVMEAIEVILYILKNNKLTKLQTDCLYHLAVGFLKLNDYHNATIYCQCLLTIEPDHQRIKDLLLEIKSRSYEGIQNNPAIVKLSTSNKILL
ncbi:unnamed protein product [Schistosoma spindalis]|nr:unnamed protein product [Schistosoma spindale]